MSTPVVDFSFIYDMAEGDKTYVYEVVSLFQTTVTSGLAKLEELINKTDDYDEIRKKAHFLKSSSNVIRVTGLKEALILLEEMAREKRDKDKMVGIISDIMVTYKSVLPLIEAEIRKNEPANA